MDYATICLDLYRRLSNDVSIRTRRSPQGKGNRCDSEYRISQTFKAAHGTGDQGTRGGLEKFEGSKVQDIRDWYNWWSVEGIIL